MIRAHVRGVAEVDIGFRALILRNAGWTDKITREGYFGPAPSNVVAARPGSQFEFEV
jgi:hypothetical protein